MKMRGRLSWDWAVLGALLIALVLAALTADRSDWSGLVGDEPTYLMQAESLAWDFDLAFDREDLKRFRDHRPFPPEIILQSGNGGESIGYGKPFFYALAIAPFVRLAPNRGPVVANAVFLTVAALFVAAATSRWLGDRAPLWVAAWLFGSVTFAHTFWVHPDLFFLCAVAVAFSLASGGAEHDRTTSRPAALSPAWRYGTRWFAVGALLAVVGTSRPFYLSLLLPAVLFVPQRRRAAGLSWLAVGVLLIAFGAAVVQHAASGSFNPYRGERRGFSQVTGMPGVDFPAEDWSETVARWGNTSWLEGDVGWAPTSPRLWIHNTTSFLFGRNVGVLVYFLPLLLGFWARPRGLAQWALLVAVGAAVVGFFLIRPFNFYGGDGALANRYFLPLYGAFWFLGTRKAGWLPPLVVTALAAPLLWSLWMAPRAYPVVPGDSHRYVSAVARRWLPVETSQKRLKAIGRADVNLGGLWVRFLNAAIRPRDEVLELQGGEIGEIVVGSGSPLRWIELELLDHIDHELQVPSHRRDLQRDGATFRIRMGRAMAVHPMWWTANPFYLYRLRLLVPESSEAIRFTVRRVGAPR